MHKWLKLLQKKNEWKMRKIADQTGKAVASCSSWFKAGIIPPEKHWPGISTFLVNEGLTEYTVEHVTSLYDQQRRAEGLIVNCHFCGDEFLRHTQTRIYCHKPKCRSLKNQKERNKIKPAEPGKYKMFNLGPGPKACQSHRITRETINESVKEFLEKGKSIEHLPSYDPGVMTRLEDEMMRAGF